MREAYARGYAVDGDFEVTAGLELRDDDPEGLSWYVRCLCELATRKGDHRGAAEYLEGVFFLDYPDRAFFIETERDGFGVQVYDPRGFVKERCCGGTGGSK